MSLQRQTWGMIPSFLLNRVLQPGGPEEERDWSGVKKDLSGSEIHRGGAAHRKRCASNNVRTEEGKVPQLPVEPCEVPEQFGALGRGTAQGHHRP